jgi:Resolvase, N terminal domain
VFLSRAGRPSALGALNGGRNRVRCLPPPFLDPWGIASTCATPWWFYKPDRGARSMKERLVLLEDEVNARGVNLHILTGMCTRLYRPDGTAIAEKMLFMVAAIAAEMTRDLIRERTVDGLRAAQAQGRHGGRPAAVNDDLLTVARARRSGASR